LFAVPRLPAFVVFNLLGHSVADGSETGAQMIERVNALRGNRFGVAVRTFALAMIHGIAQEPFRYLFGTIHPTRGLTELAKRLFALPLEEIRQAVAKTQQMAAREPYQEGLTWPLAERIIVMTGVWGAKIVLEQNRTTASVPG
jgi:hypothetical protein